MGTARTGEVRRRHEWLAMLVPAIAALAVYAGTLRSGFVYDDEVLIRSNPAVRDAAFLKHVATTPLFATVGAGAANYYRPLPVAAYNALWHAGGGSPLPFHLASVVLHATNAVLVLLLVRLVSRRGPLVAAGAATLFAVHPLATEAVAWASGLPEVMYAGFSLAALTLHAASWSRSGRRASAMRAAAWAAFLLGCFCKETALAVVPLIALLEAWARPDSDARTVARAWWRGVLPYVAAAGIAVAVRTAVLGGIVAGAHQRELTLGDAIFTGGRLLLGYFGLMAVPLTLVVDRGGEAVPGPLHAAFLVPAAVVVAAAVGVVSLKRRRPDLAFACALAAVPLLPALYLPALGRDLLAERYAYLPLAGACWAAVGGLAAAVARTGDRAAGRVAAVLTVALVAAASWRTIVRTGDWRDDGALGRATVRDAPQAAVGYLLLGNWEAARGRTDDAARVFDAGLARIPDSTELRLNALVLASRTGRIASDQAIAAYRDLAASAPTNASVAFNLGQALLAAGRLDEADAAFARALDLAPASVANLIALAVVASERGDQTAAAGYCRRALAVDPRSTAALQQLGVALLRAGETAGAVAALERAISVDPGDKEALTRLGVAYARAGRMEDARRSWEAALRIDPGFTKARANLERLDRPRP